MTESCVVCDNERSRHTIFCKNHLKAYKNIIDTYKKWIKAYGPIDEKNYLNRISTNPFTGQWAKEVALYLLKNGGSINV
jgi:hypothetical protein